jgi:spore coat protein U-like protein
MICSLVVSLMLSIAPGADAAMNCRVTVSPVDFGLYSPADSAPLDITGEIAVVCAGTDGLFAATLSPGASGTFAERHMFSGSFAMRYNFYADPGRTLIWGDGTGGSVPVQRTKPAPGRQIFNLPVYVRVFRGQSVAAGAYADSILVTIVF